MNFRSTKSKRLPSEQREKSRPKVQPVKRLPLSVNASILLIFCMLGGLVYIGAGNFFKKFILCKSDLHLSGFISRKIRRTFQTLPKKNFDAALMAGILPLLRNY